MRRKIILTGYRATGKSTIGKMLAERLGYAFIDTDKLIEQRQGCSIGEMVAAHGWDYFRTQEKDLLLELVPLAEVVIATGGGAIQHHDAWSKLMDSGLSVWLVADEKTICARLAKDGHLLNQRPSLTGKGIGQEVAETLAHREDLYRLGSHLAISTVELSASAVVDAVLTHLEKGSSKGGR